jgi:hypothetical protein
MKNISDETKMVVTWFGGSAVAIGIIAAVLHHLKVSQDLFLLIVVGLFSLLVLAAGFLGLLVWNINYTGDKIFGRRHPINFIQSLVHKMFGFLRTLGKKTA